MPEYATKKDLARIFDKSERTIQRWIDEGRYISRAGKEYRPEQDPGGCWRFEVGKAQFAMTNNDKV